ncbi:hypothetical protein RFI_29868, partial [Reticulomyxa filosa]
RRQENNNNFQFHQLPVCDDIAPFHSYAYVHINDVILFFGEWDNKFIDVSKSVHKYSIRENEWMVFQNALLRLRYSIVILSEKDNTKTRVCVCDPSMLVMIWSLRTRNLLWF